MARKDAQRSYQRLSSSGGAAPESLLIGGRHGMTRVAAAIALGLILGPQADDDAVSVLLDGDRWRAELDATVQLLPFARSLNGYVARALHRVEG